MTDFVPAELAPHVGLSASAPRLSINVFTGRDMSVVHVTGELDLATRNQLVSASIAGRQPQTMIDLGGVTFMDCSGYRSLVAARRFIESEGRSLTITGQAGQPARFLDLIAELERCPLRPALNSSSASPHHSSGSRRHGRVGVPVALHNH